MWLLARRSKPGQELLLAGRFQFSLGVNASSPYAQQLTVFGARQSVHAAEAAPAGNLGIDIKHELRRRTPGQRETASPQL